MRLVRGAPDGRTSPHRPWRAYALVLVIVAALVLMVALHLAGVFGPGSH
jgi:hypothetical protein